MTDTGPAPMGPRSGNGKARVLLIAYHFPPMNVISAYRAEAFAAYLPAHGFDMSVLTTVCDVGPDGKLAWQAHGTKVQTTREGPINVIRIPRTRTLGQRWLERALTMPFLGKALTLCFHASGTFNLHLVQFHAHSKGFLKSHLRTHAYDLVIASAPPDEHLRLAAWIKRHYGIPFIADYRDPYDLRPMDARYKRTWKDRLLLAFKHRYHSQWTRHCSLLVSISKPCLEAIAQHHPKARTLEVRNGYFPHKALIDGNLIRRDLFKITYAGRIYPWQDVRPFMEAYRIFTARLSPEELRQVDLAFLGCQDEEQANQLRQGLNGLPLRITLKRIPEREARDQVAESAVLLVFDIGIRGGYTGKLMDYLGCRRNVLLVPSDHGVMEELIIGAGIGHATGEPTLAAERLLRWFREWQTNGRPAFNGHEPVIQEGSREAQTARLALVAQELIHQRRNPTAPTTE